MKAALTVHIQWVLSVQTGETVKYDPGRPEVCVQKQMSLNWIWIILDWKVIMVAVILPLLLWSWGKQQKYSNQCSCPIQTNEEAFFHAVVFSLSERDGMQTAVSSVKDSLHTLSSTVTSSRWRFAVLNVTVLPTFSTPESQQSFFSHPQDVLQNINRGNFWCFSVWSNDWCRYWYTEQRLNVTFYYLYFIISLIVREDFATSAVLTFILKIIFVSISSAQTEKHTALHRDVQDIMDRSTKEELFSAL